MPVGNKIFYRVGVGRSVAYKTKTEQVRICPMPQQKLQERDKSLNKKSERNPKYIPGRVPEKKSGKNSIQVFMRFRQR